MMRRRSRLIGGGLGALALGGAGVAGWRRTRAAADLARPSHTGNPRQSDYDGAAVSAVDLSLLATAVAVLGVDLISERAQIDRLRDLVIAGNTAQMADPAFVAELMHWLRFNPAAAMTTGDGLYSVASGNPALPD